eukprot:5575894-Amphidinium_carterae.1
MVPALCADPCERIGKSCVPRVEQTNQRPIQLVLNLAAVRGQDVRRRALQGKLYKSDGCYLPPNWRMVFKALQMSSSL